MFIYKFGILAVSAVLVQSASTRAATFYDNAAAYKAATHANMVYNFDSAVPANAQFVNVATTFTSGPVTFSGTVPFVIKGSFFGGNLYGNQTFYSDQGLDTGRTTVLSLAGVTAFAMNFGSYATSAGALLSVTLGDGSTGGSVFPLAGVSRFIGFTSLTPITKITLVNSGGISIDIIDYTLGSADAVPEPASWALMIAGFGAIGTTMRRRREVAVSS